MEISLWNGEGAWTNLGIEKDDGVFSSLKHMYWIIWSYSWLCHQTTVWSVSCAFVSLSIKWFYGNVAFLFFFFIFFPFSLSFEPEFSSKKLRGRRVPLKNIPCKVLWMLKALGYTTYMFQILKKLKISSCLLVDEEVKHFPNSKTDFWQSLSKVCRVLLTFQVWLGSECANGNL